MLLLAKIIRYLQPCIPVPLKGLVGKIAVRSSSCTWLSSGANLHSFGVSHLYILNPPDGTSYSKMLLLESDSQKYLRILVNLINFLHMANDDVARDETDWIERVKSGGAVPLLEPDNCPNGWATPPGHVFMVRGPDYLSTKVKIPGSDYLLKPLGFDWIKASTKISEILNNPNSRVRRAIEEEFPEVNRPFVWAFHLQLPNKDNHSAVAYFLAPEPFPEGSLVDQFLKGDNSFRNSRLKLIANIVKGPWIVKKAVGEQAICIIGRAVSCKYHVSEFFMEVDIDIGSSMVASAIVHLAFGYIMALTVDLAFVIEGQTESELPERILGAVRFSELNPASAKQIDTPENSDDLQSSLPTSWWKSIGQGFSHLLHAGPQENGSSGLVHANGTVEHEESVEGSKNGTSCDFM
ncbi:Protein ENHANCED DISEASE RESISTANCE 2, C-terminal [Dillenia turbinata]|uniref:Protein ENHANCED DISEASE RESISTANCE 2, C-terminal n=1 Tax=Dillenia turbinata TaxID=194707 RepID=A0AAN8UFN0_9MAGN